MKKRISLLILVVIFSVGFSFLAQWYTTKNYENPFFGQPVFQTDQPIIAIQFDSYVMEHQRVVVPASSMDNIVDWLRQFTVSTRLGHAGDEYVPMPGTGSLEITVTYADGSRQTTGRHIVLIDSVYYTIDSPDAPDIFASLTTDMPLVDDN